MARLATDDEMLESDGGDLAEAFKAIGSYGSEFKICAKDVAALMEGAKSR